MKHLSTVRKRKYSDTVSSGERKRHSLNLFFPSDFPEDEMGVAGLTIKRFVFPSRTIWNN